MSRSRLTVHEHRSHVTMRVNTTGGPEVEAEIINEILQTRSRGWRTKKVLVLELHPNGVSQSTMEVLLEYCSLHAAAVATWVNYPSPPLARVYCTNAPDRYRVGDVFRAMSDRATVAGVGQSP